MIYIFDVDGNRLVFWGAFGPAATEADVEEVDAIVQSFEFTAALNRGFLEGSNEAGRSHRAGPLRRGGVSARQGVIPNSARKSRSSG